MATDKIGIANDPYGFVPTLKEINALPKKFKVFSTFSGVGGSSMGYKMAGIDVIGAVEFLDYQAETYRTNHPGTKVYQTDIRALSPKEILAELGLKRGELDILDGSPPCSGFSMLGIREKGWGVVKKYGNTEQQVDDLFMEYARFLHEMQPKVFVAENVPGLVAGKAKGYFKEIFRTLRSCGYDVKAKVMSSKHYGVPQDRERLIFIGVRHGLEIEPSYPKPSSKVITIGQAWEKVKTNPTAHLEMMERMDKQKAVKSVISRIPKNPKRNINASKIHINGSYFNYTRLSYNAPAPTLIATSGGAIHPSFDRTLTIDELKAGSSFPMDFKLLGDYDRQWEGCGRSVPPLMMYEIAKHIKENILQKI